MKTTALILGLLSTVALPAWAQNDAELRAVTFGGAFGAYAGTYFGTRDGGTGFFSASSTSRQGGYAQAAASASLADGKLHAAAFTSQLPCSRAGCSTHVSTSAAAIYWDTVTFMNGRSAGLADVAVSVDGSLSPLGGNASVRWFMGDRPRDFWSNPNRHTELHTLSTGTTAIGDELLVPLGESTYFIYAALYTAADSLFTDDGYGYSGYADFGNTLHFNWTLPEGVVVRSASGQFMTSAVPEPASGLMALTGLGALLARRRVQRAG
ncbi:MAG: hypothetical protein RJA10_3292 [Pseudomonadota bacterium]|jgi:hypothetical protein